MFLYPTLTFFFSDTAFSWLNFSSCSEVKGSPGSTLLATLEGGDVERIEGDVDRVEEGTLTAVESLVVTEELEPGPVRRAKAARRGRGAVILLLLAEGEELRLIRAAS